ncbi:MAG: HD domain-containing protein [Clostridium sp.]|nr:HD domain-containing protein [Clostridium sp.]
MMEDKIEKVKGCLKELFKEEYSGHDYWHSIRVYNNAMKIAENESCDLLVTALVALLHDADDYKLFKTSDYSNARKILAVLNFDEAVIDNVINAISTVSFKGCNTEQSDTIEGKIVQDADRLDAIGALGIARAFAYGGSRNRQMHNPNIPPDLNMTEDEYKKSNSTTINHFYEKLFLLKDLMNTDSGRKIAEKRTEYMQEFIDTFYNEWDGNDF